MKGYETKIMLNNGDEIVIDRDISVLIEKINTKKGVETLYSCSGTHQNYNDVENSKLRRSGYIMFPYNKYTLDVCLEILDISTKYMRSISKLIYEASNSIIHIEINKDLMDYRDIDKNIVIRIETEVMRLYTTNDKIIEMYEYIASKL